ncbi:uncharacterized protein LOC132350874 isoform X3 [Balaenoptera ricei]|uniref:uncharacterized protein LOC132350874 isoform X3 n=1 Tax=Balaenoptera ricei TaxID=2746895 RepID=UPI0028BE3B0A|nr:uncharacterized protein LOC132350874 isoform X3 [Balaenoptera ricei]
MKEDIRCPLDPAHHEAACSLLGLQNESYFRLRNIVLIWQQRGCCLFKRSAIAASFWLVLCKTNGRQKQAQSRQESSPSLHRQEVMGMNLTPEPALLTTTLHCPSVLVSKMDEMQTRPPKGTEPQKQTEAAVQGHFLQEALPEFSCPPFSGLLRCWVCGQRGNASIGAKNSTWHNAGCPAGTL